MLNRPKPHRRSRRLSDYDYSSEGAYFVTICTKNRECLSGSIEIGQMVLKQAGKMIKNWWVDIPKRFEGVEVDEFSTMPNHFHGIVVLVGADRRVCPEGLGGQGLKKGEHIGSPLQNTVKSHSPSLSKIVQWFKTMTTNEYLRNVKNKNWPPFPGRLWQRNYFEHVIRNENSWNKIRPYIMANPLNWPLDIENPATVSNPNARRGEEKFCHELT